MSLETYEQRPFAFFVCRFVHSENSSLNLLKGKAQKGSLEVKVPSVEKIWIASSSPTVLDHFALERYMHKPGRNGDDEEGVEDDKEHNHPVREVKLAQNIWKDQQGCQKTT